MTDISQLQCCYGNSVAMCYLNTGGALLGSPMRIALHGKSRVLSAMSVELN